MTEALFAADLDGLGINVSDHHFADSGVVGLEEALFPVARESDSGTEILHTYPAFILAEVDDDGGFFREESESQGFGDEQGASGLGTVRDVKGGLNAGKCECLTIYVQRDIVEGIIDNRKRMRGHLYDELQPVVNICRRFERKQIMDHLLF